jgi:hypothetical protein
MTASTPRPTQWNLVPLPQMQRLAHEGRIGVAPRFFGALTNRSHRVTIETEAPETLLARSRKIR